MTKITPAILQPCKPDKPHDLYIDIWISNRENEAYDYRMFAKVEVRAELSVDIVTMSCDKIAIRDMGKTAIVTAAHHWPTLGREECRIALEMGMFTAETIFIGNYGILPLVYLHSYSYTDYADKVYKAENSETVPHVRIPNNPLYPLYPHRRK